MLYALPRIARRAELGGYDGRFDGVEDVEFALRAHAAGHRVVPAGVATVAYRLRSDLSSVWRQGTANGRRRPALAAQASALGLRGPSRVAGLKSVLWLMVFLPFIVTRRGRFAWTWTLATRYGVLRGVVERSLKAGARS